MSRVRLGLGISTDRKDLNFDPAEEPSPQSGHQQRKVVLPSMGLSPHLKWYVYMLSVFQDHFCDFRTMGPAQTHLTGEWFQTARSRHPSDDRGFGSMRIQTAQETHGCHLSNMSPEVWTTTKGGGGKKCRYRQKYRIEARTGIYGSIG
jgi:hypothetical protein